MSEKSRLLERVISWLRQTLTWRSPNQRTSSIAGSLVGLITVHWLVDAFSDLFATPVVGLVVGISVAAMLGFTTEITIRKILAKSRPEGEHWPDGEDEDN